MISIFIPDIKYTFFRIAVFCRSCHQVDRLNLVVLVLALFLSLDFIFAKPCFAEVGNHIEFGAGLHLGQGKTYANSALQTLRLMGFTSFRDEISWGRLEDKQKQFGLGRVPQSLKNALISNDLSGNAMLVLAYGNENYDGGGRPVSEEGREAFKRYAFEVSRLNPHVRYLELWNEWNHAIGVKDGSKGSADDYVRLVSTVVPALRAAGTKSNIVVGALADDYPDWAFARELVHQGILTYADGFSVHLYNYSAGDKALPQEMLGRLERLQAILRAGNGGKDFPVLVTEFGWPTNLGNGGIDQRQAGIYIAQLMFEATAYPWLRGLWLYELFDSGSSKFDKEHNFGIFDANGNAKNGACMVRASLSLLKDAKYNARGVTSNGVRWIQFNKLGGTLFVIYSPGFDKKRKISLRSGLWGAAMPLCGAVNELISANISSGWEIKTIGGEPLILYFEDQVNSPNEIFQ